MERAASRRSRGCGFAKFDDAFTLLEMLVGMAVLAVIMVLLFQVLTSTSSLWTRSLAKVQVFQSARAAWDALTRNLSQATLQSYLSYADASGNPVPLINPSATTAGLDRSKIPTRYLRMSELHFLSGPAADLLGAGVKVSGDAIFFQAPLGLSGSSSYQVRAGVLNVCGYFVQFCGNNDDGGRGTGAIPTNLSPAPQATYRYRLMEVIQPTEKNYVYQSTDLVDSKGLPILTYDLDWLTRISPDKRGSRHVLADNVILLLALPKLAPEDEKLNGGVGDGSLIAPHYVYDSRSWEAGYTGQGITPSVNRPLVESLIMNRLPPIMEVIMVAIDETSAQRLAAQYGGDGSQPPLENGTLRGKLGLDTGFTSAANLHGANGDLAKLRQGLDSLSINYRIFQTEVRLPEASYNE